LLHGLLFNVVEVDPTQFNIHVAFESINHRGKQLTQLELLKNRLIYVTAVIGRHNVHQEGCPSSEKLRENVNSTWNDIYRWLGRQGKTALDEDEFLRAHTIMYFDVDTSKADWLDMALFSDSFSIDRAVQRQLGTDEVSRYLD